MVRTLTEAAEGSRVSTRMQAFWALGNLAAALAGSQSGLVASPWAPRLAPVVLGAFDDQAKVAGTAIRASAYVIPGLMAADVRGETPLLESFVDALVAKVTAEHEHSFDARRPNAAAATKQAWNACAALGRVLRSVAAEPRGDVVQAPWLPRALRALLGAVRHSQNFKVRRKANLPTSARFPGHALVFEKEPQAHGLLHSSPLPLFGPC